MPVCFGTRLCGYRNRGWTYATTSILVYIKSRNNKIRMIFFNETSLFNNAFLTSLIKYSHREAFVG